jgi:putative GTP pyrophosphokinase
MSDAGGSRMNRSEFLNRHNVSEKDFKSCGLEWSILQDIADHHRGRFAELQSTAAMLVQRLQQVAHVHSLKFRIKDPEHLVAKLIRKKLERPKLSFDVHSYPEKVSDLIGVRALHLFKDQWKPIHEFVRQTWKLHEKPIANYREGDPAGLLDDFRSSKLQLKKHRFGYRSIHYVLALQPPRRTHLAELQVRTVFEEGWSEIDHGVRYPRHSDDPYLAEILRIFNGLAGSADEIGTFVKALSRYLHEQAAAVADQKIKVAEKEAALKSVISDLQIGREDKAKLQKQVDDLKKSSSTLLSFSTGSDWPELTSIPRSSSFSALVGLSDPSLSNIVIGGTRDRACDTCGKQYKRDLLKFSLHNRCDECEKRSGP